MYKIRVVNRITSSIVYDSDWVYPTKVAARKAGILKKKEFSQDRLWIVEMLVRRIEFVEKF